MLQFAISTAIFLGASEEKAAFIKQLATLKCARTRALRLSPARALSASRSLFSSARVAKREREPSLPSERARGSGRALFSRGARCARRDALSRAAVGARYLRERGGAHQAAETLFGEHVSRGRASSVLSDHAGGGAGARAPAAPGSSGGASSSEQVGLHEEFDAVFVHPRRVHSCPVTGSDGAF